MAVQAVGVLITGANRGLSLGTVKKLVACLCGIRFCIIWVMKLFSLCLQAFQTLAKKHPNIIRIKLYATDLCGCLARGSLQDISPEDLQKTVNTNAMGQNEERGGPSVVTSTQIVILHFFKIKEGNWTLTLCLHPGHVHTDKGRQEVSQQVSTDLTGSSLKYIQ
uniref:Uncharacterized protein n=1 Tax=Seriola dumerili TaxID=41447 RepID=A0A3B4UQ44_SERDU